MRNIRRRSVLSLPVLVGTAGGCSLLQGSEPGGESSGTVSGAGSVGAASAASQVVESHFLGNRLSVAVSPVVRVSKDVSMVRLDLTRPKDDAAMKEVRSVWVGDGDTLDLADALFRFDKPGYPYATLVDLDGGQVWVTTQDVNYTFISLGRGDSGTVCAPFGPVDVDEVRVFVPMTGFVPVQVMDRDAASQAGVDLGAMDTALEDVIVDSSVAAPVVLERFTRAVDDSASTLRTGGEVVVTLSSDVTFESDSADLSEQADGQLQRVADQVGRYPKGGTLVIVGHTDDVQDDGYNQELSERRAGAVKERLEGLADLGPWEVSTSGKGETEPLVEGTTDEARAANRRVEITLTPTGGTTGGQGSGDGGSSGTASPSPSAAAPSSGPAESSGSSGGPLPEAKGPVGKGPEGVTVPGPGGGGEVTVVLDQVTRVGGYLLGELEVTTGEEGGAEHKVGKWLCDPVEGYGVNVRGEEMPLTDGISSGVTLLAGGERVFPVDYRVKGSKARMPLTEWALDDPLSGGGLVTRVCVAWPDTGQGALILDHEGEDGGSDYAYRLTDVPVVEG